MRIKKFIRKLLRQVGYDITQYSPLSNPLARRKKLLDEYKINHVLDVGANAGQYGLELRSIGYKQKITSFEPLSTAYNQLSTNSEKDKSWKSFHFALGDTNGHTDINIAGNSYSSSLLNMLPAHLQSAPQSKYVGQENIEIKTIDSIFDKIGGPKQNIYLKIDTQGFEEKVLKGAADSLVHINTIQIEMSLIPLYEGELLFKDMSNLLYQKRYSLVSLEPGLSDKKTGQLLQVDAIFHRL